MSALDDCLAALIATLEAESEALARHDHVAATSFLDSKAVLSATLQRLVSTLSGNDGPHTPALVQRLRRTVTANRAQLERAMRVRRHMLDLLRESARRSVGTTLYTSMGGSRAGTHIRAAAFTARI